MSLLLVDPPVVAAEPDADVQLPSTDGSLAGPRIGTEGSLAGASIGTEGSLAGPRIGTEGSLAGPRIGNEDALVAAAVAGDPRAREQLLAEVRPFVVRYCRARLGNRDTVAGSADDIAQEVCLAVARALPGYSITSTPFTAFVYGIAAHKVVDAFRVIGRNRCDPVAEIPDEVDDRRGPEHRALAGELAAEVHELLEVLSPRQREILVLRVAVGLSAKETAEAVGTTPEAVRVAQHRALTRLRGLATR
jgi:RNA polymerase sigma-70 factor, ECF subfamily